MLSKIWNWFWRGIATIVIVALRAVCAARGRVRIIKRPDQAAPYLIRYAIMGWLPGDKDRPTWLPNIYLHNIRLLDADPALHNHPWPWAVSLILRGGYRERRQIERGANPFGKWILAGHFNVLRTPQDFHRIAQVAERTISQAEHMAPVVQRGEGCWTLFVTSGKHASWGFDVPGEGFVPHTVRALTSGPSPVQRAMIDGLREINQREQAHNITSEMGHIVSSGPMPSPVGGYTWQPRSESPAGRLPSPPNSQPHWDYKPEEKREIREMIDINFAELEARVLARAGEEP